MSLFFVLSFEKLGSVYFFLTAYPVCISIYSYPRKNKASNCLLNYLIATKSRSILKACVAAASAPEKIKINSLVSLNLKIFLPALTFFNELILLLKSPSPSLFCHILLNLLPCRKRCMIKGSLVQICLCQV